MRNLARFLGTQSEFRLLIAALFGVITYCVLRHIQTKWLLVVGSAILLAQLMYMFPYNSNHFYIELLCILGVCIAYQTKDTTEQRWHNALVYLQGILLITLLWSGMQKILYGTYSHGEYFANSLQHSERFTGTLGWLSQNAFNNPFVLLVSNSVYVLEIVTALLLWYPKTRAIGFAGVTLLLLAIEIIAHEFFFGLLVVGLLLLWSKHGITAKRVQLLGVCYIALCIAITLPVPFTIFT